MTTEQMDWLDDERAGRHAPKVLHGHPTEEEIAEARKDAPFGVLIIPTEEPEPYFDAEGYTPEEREKIKAQTTMASEDPAHRDRRNWLDGYLAGFREGFERGEWR